MKSENRNLYQWLAVVFMTIDHLSVFFDGSMVFVLNVIGRLGFPLYAYLFVLTMRYNRVNLKRLFFLAMVSQVPHFFLFHAYEFNVIFGFFFYAVLVDVCRRRLYEVQVLILMVIVFVPVEYSWYLYLVLFSFHFAGKNLFMMSTLVYSLAPGLFLQVYAVLVLLIPKVRVSRMNKYFYRYFYPLHLTLFSLLKMFLILMVVFVVGCEVSDSQINPPEFSSAYKEMTVVDVKEYEELKSSKILSFVANDLPLRYFVRWLADVTGSSVVTSEELDNRKLTANIQNQTLDTIIEFVSRRYSMQVIKTGTMYYIGDLRPEDKGVLVRKVRKLDRQGLQSAIANLLSEYGRASTYEDGLCVVSDKVKVLNKVDEMLTLIESASVNSWVVQLYMISVREKYMRSLGLDVNMSAEFSYNSISGSKNVSGSQTAMVLNGLLRADIDTDDITVEASPLFVLVDGVKTQFYVGEEYPIEKKSVSDQGTVSTTGYDYIPVGLEFDVGLREVSSMYARLSVDLKMSSVVGFNKDAPITDNQRYSTEAVCKMQGVYLLGSLKKKEIRRTVGGLMRSYSSDQTLDTHLQIWAKIFRVSSPVSNDIGDAMDLQPGSETLIPLAGGETLTPSIDRETLTQPVLTEKEKFMKKREEMLKKFRR